jgi:hypothetical protein
MNKTTSDREIDLIDLFIVVLNKKKIIFSITVIAIILGIIYKSLDENKKKIIFLLNGEIKPISYIEESKYVIFNSYIKSIKPKISEVKFIFPTTNDPLNTDLEKSIQVTNSSLTMGDFNIKEINKLFLFNLFLEKIGEKENLLSYIEKFRLTKANDKKDDQLEKNINDLLSSINNKQVKNQKKKKIVDTIDPIVFKLKTDDIDEAKEFLTFIQEEVNFEIQENLDEMLNDYFSYVESIIEFQIEDIDTQSNFTSNKSELELLEIKKKILKSDKYIERIKKVYLTSPVSKSDDFYAAQIVYNSSETKTLNRPVTLKKIVILFGLLGATLGIIIVLISKAVELRRLK